MRIFTVYFQVLLFLVLSISSTPLFGNNLETKSEKNLLTSEVLVMPDTTCGLMDTLIQLTLPSCPGASDATATIQFEGNPDSLMIEWDNGVTGDTVTGLNAGLHFVTVTDNNSCMLIDSIMITDKPIFDYTIEATNALCIGVSNGNISISDTVNLMYNWSTGDSTNTISNLGRGAYEVTISDGNGCAIAETIIIEVDTQATLQLVGTPATCLGINDGSVSANDSLNLVGYKYLWSTGDTTNSLANINVGTYFVLATSSDGCLAADSFNITATRGVPLEATIVNTSCPEVNDGSITINDTLDVTGFQFGWSNGETTQTISNLDTGTYSVAIVDTTGCLAGATFNITAGMPFEVNLTSSNATCDGVNNGTVSVNDTTGVEGLSILWNTGDTTQTITGLAAGIYSVTLSDDSGCSNTGSIQVITDAVDDPVVDVTNVSCAGLTDGSIIINGNVLDTTTTYVWSTGDSTNALVNIGTGGYDVQITDSMGCVSSLSFNILATSSLDLTLSSTNVSCAGVSDGTATINEGADLSGLTITWNTGDSIQTISNLSSGNYIATVTDTIGCFAVDSILIEADSSLQIGLTGNNINCTDVNDGRVGATVIGADSNDGLTFVWSTGDTTQTISNLAPGEYEVTVTDADGCSGIGGVNLNEADTINLVLVVSELACMDTVATGGILAFASGGSGNFTYNWSTGDSTDTVTDIMAGTYIVTVTDSLGCVVVDSATLATPPDLIVSTSLTQAPTCDGTEDGSVAVNVSGGTSPYSIRWNTGIITSTLENLNPGSYTVEVSDDAGCMITDSITIEGSTDITVTVSELNGASSQNSADASATVTATGGLAPYTFNWDNGAVGDTVTNLSPGNHDVVATDANGCTATGNIDVSFFDLSVSIIETRNLACNGAMNGRATAAPNTGTAPFAYVWSTGDTLPILTNLPGGSHSVTVTDVDGRKGTASITLTEPAPINFNLEIIPPGCPTSANGRITINATGTTGNPLYDFGVGISTDPFILGVTVGTKRYGIIDGPCRADTVFTIESVSANPPIPAFEVQSIGLNASFTDSTTNDPFDYLWKFGDGTTSEEVNPAHQYPDTGNYEVTLIVSNACATDSISQTVTIAPIPIPGVELIFGRDTSSLSGQVVSIPVTVGAFEDLAGFSGTFEFTNPMIGTIQGVRDLNLPNLTEANIAFQQNLVSVNWMVADTSQLVTLPNGTQIFVIDVLLTGASDACTEVVGTNAESTLQFTKTFMGELVPAPFVINSAEICIAATVSIAGNVSREEDSNVSGVTVTTNDEVSSTTMADGNYALPGLPGGATFNINASKSDELLQGVTTFDLVAILQHILTQTPLDSPYKIIAADIDNSGSVSSLDLVHLQRLILQKIDAFPNNQPWRFVPESYVFSNPTNPLSENFPETITVNRLEIDTTNIDFVAIKIGDVVNAQNSGGARFLNKAMGFEIEEQTFKKGDLVKVPFIFESESAALGFQLELDFDYKKLAFKGAAKDNFLKVGDNNFGVKDLEYGRLKMLWVNSQQLPIRPLAKGLFQLEFIALADGNLSSALQVVNEQFPAQFYTKQNTKIGLQNIDLTINNARIETEEEVLTDTPPTQFLAPGEGIGEGGCGDGIDNDNDGLIDCADADCFCECNMETPNNLIINPSAEMSLTADGAWQSVLGAWETRGNNPDPQSGAAYFYAGDNEMGQLTQVVDLSPDSAAIAAGNAQYIFSAYARSFDQDPADDGQILIEFRNNRDSTVARFDSGLITSPMGWQLLTDTIAVPEGTAIATISLIATRKNGTNNDAYFDNLSLTRIISDECVDPCENVAILAITTDAIPNSVQGSVTAILSGATGPVTYNWSNGDSTSTLENLPAGTLMVEASDSIGCTATETIEIASDSTFFVSFNTTPNACNGDMNGGVAVEVSGGTAPFVFTWQDTTLIGDTLMNLASGTYPLTVVDADGASVTATATVESGVTIQFNTTDSKIINESCPAVGDGQLSLVAEGGTAPYQYIINTDTTNNGVYLGLNAGTYSVTISDAAGCSTVDDITVENTLAGTLSADFTAMATDTSVNLTASTQDTTATYAWTFGDGNSSAESNPTAIYAAPGTYEICLTISNPCGSEMTCQTVTIGVGGPVRFILNDLNGIANDTVIVPVTVQNFVDIVSYQKTIQIQDTSIARIVGISDPNLDGLTLDNFFQVDPHTVTTVWFDASSDGKTLPNNTVLYNLMIMIDSQVDTCVGINFVESPVASQVVGIMIDEVAEVPYELVNGEICTSESGEVSGTILRETRSAVPGVTLSVSNIELTSTTDIDGNYLIEKLPLGNEYEITPTLSEPLLEGVSTFDIVLINRHILGTRILDSPYKIIAADINQSETITVFDLVLIQRAILGLNDNFPGNSAWRFIPTNYQFPDPLNPFSEVFPESITVSTNGDMLTNQDFVAVKIADVSYNVPSLAGTATPRSSQQLTFNMANAAYKAGDLITIPVSAAQLNDYAGFQLELDFDKNELDFVNIKAVDLPAFDNNNVGVKHLNKGKLQMIWVAPSQDLPRATTTLFNLQFKAKTAGTLSNTLALANRYLTSESYTEDAEIGRVELNFNDSKTTQPSTLSVYPNPTKGTIDLSFENTTNEKVQLVLYNFTGQLVKEWKDLSGENAQLDLSNFNNGTYMLMLRKGINIEVQTIILNR